MTGQTNSASKSWKNAWATAVLRMMKARYTNQCRAPIHGRCSMRVCPKVSMNMLTVRFIGWSVRPTERWPVRRTPTMVRTARTVMGTATTVNSSEMTIAATCMEASFRVQSGP